MHFGTDMEIEDQNTEDVFGFWFLLVFSAFLLRISYFHEKKQQQKVPSKSENFCSRIKSIWVWESTEFYADFRSKGEFQDKCNG